MTTPPKENLHPFRNLPQVYSSQSLCALRRSKPWGVGRWHVSVPTFHLHKELDAQRNSYPNRSNVNMFLTWKKTESSSFTNSMFGIQMEGGKLLPFDGIWKGNPSSATQDPHKIAGLIWGLVSGGIGGGSPFITWYNIDHFFGWWQLKHFWFSPQKFGEDEALLTIFLKDGWLAHHLDMRVQSGNPGFPSKHACVKEKSGIWYLPSTEWTYPTKREVRKIIDSKVPGTGGGYVIVPGRVSRNIWRFQKF